jgi:hypothetical protein
MSEIVPALRIVLILEWTAHVSKGGQRPTLPEMGPQGQVVIVQLLTRSCRDSA